MVGGWLDPDVDEGSEDDDEEDYALDEGGGGWLWLASSSPHVGGKAAAISSKDLLASSSPQSAGAPLPLANASGLPDGSSAQQRQESNGNEVTVSCKAFPQDRSGDDHAPMLLEVEVTQSLESRKKRKRVGDGIEAVGSRSTIGEEVQVNDHGRTASTEVVDVVAQVGGASPATVNSGQLPNTDLELRDAQREEKAPQHPKSMQADKLSLEHALVASQVNEQEVVKSSDAEAGERRSHDEVSGGDEGQMDDSELRRRKSKMLWQVLLRQVDLTRLQKKIEVLILVKQAVHELPTVLEDTPPGLIHMASPSKEEEGEDELLDTEEEAEDLSYPPTFVHNERCEACSTRGELLLCDGAGCTTTYHLACCTPPLEEIPFGNWYCPECAYKRIKEGVDVVASTVESIWGMRSNSRGLPFTLLPSPSKPKDTSLLIEMEDLLLFHFSMLPGALSDEVRTGPSNSDPTWVGEGISNGQAEAEYFVKWAGASHCHNSWLKESEVLSAPQGAQVLAAYKKLWACGKVNQEDLPLIFFLGPAAFSFTCAKLLGARQVRKWKDLWTKPQRLLSSKEIMPPVFSPSRRLSSGSIRWQATSSTIGKEWLVKWRTLPYSCCTWEPSNEETLATAEAITLQSHLQSRHLICQRRLDPSKAAEVEAKRKGEPSVSVQLPKGLQSLGAKSMSYQVDCLNWLISRWKSADDHALTSFSRGLGRRFATILFLEVVLQQYQMPRAVLIIGEASCLFRWEAQLEHFLPDVNTVHLKGGKASRNLILKEELGPNPTIAQCVLASPEVINEELEFFVTEKWGIIVLESPGWASVPVKPLGSLSQLHADFRLALSEKPLADQPQASARFLLHFMNPSKYSLEEQAEGWSPAETSLKKVTARVEKREHKAVKVVEMWLPVDMRRIQKEYYRAILRSQAGLLMSGKQQLESGGVTLQDVIAQLRMCCDHASLVAGTTRMQWALQLADESSGKLQVLQHLLNHFRQLEEKVVLLYQVHAMGAILEDVFLRRANFNYTFIDSANTIGVKLAQVAEFSTWTSGVIVMTPQDLDISIDIATISVVIFYDHNWDPLLDLQALERPARFGMAGQPLQVYRLFTRHSVEQQFFQRYHAAARDGSTNNLGKLVALAGLPHDMEEAPQPCEKVRECQEILTVGAAEQFKDNRLAESPQKGEAKLVEGMVMHLHAKMVEACCQSPSQSGREVLLFNSDNNVEDVETSGQQSKETRSSGDDMDDQDDTQSPWKWVWMDILSGPKRQEEREESRDAGPAEARTQETTQEEIVSLLDHVQHTLEVTNVPTTISASDDAAQLSERPSSCEQVSATGELEVPQPAEEAVNIAEPAGGFGPSQKVTEPGQPRQAETVSGGAEDLEGSESHHQVTQSPEPEAQQLALDAQDEVSQQDKVLENGNKVMLPPEPEQPQLVGDESARSAAPPVAEHSLEMHLASPGAAAVATGDEVEGEAHAGREGGHNAHQVSSNQGGEGSQVGVDTVQEASREAEPREQVALDVAGSQVEADDIVRIVRSELKQACRLLELSDKVEKGALETFVILTSRYRLKKRTMVAMISTVLTLCRIAAERELVVFDFQDWLDRVTKHKDVRVPRHKLDAIYQRLVRTLSSLTNNSVDSTPSPTPPESATTGRTQSDHAQVDQLSEPPLAGPSGPLLQEHFGVNDFGTAAADDPNAVLASGAHDPDLPPAPSLFRLSVPSVSNDSLDQIATTANQGAASEPVQSLQPAQEMLDHLTDASLTRGLQSTQAPANESQPDRPPGFSAWSSAWISAIDLQEWQATDTRLLMQRQQQESQSLQLRLENAFNVLDRQLAIEVVQQVAAGYPADKQEAEQRQRTAARLLLVQQHAVIRKQQAFSMQEAREALRRQHRDQQRQLALQQRRSSGGAAAEAATEPCAALPASVAAAAPGHEPTSQQRQDDMPGRIQATGPQPQELAEAPDPAPAPALREAATAAAKRSLRPLIPARPLPSAGLPEVLERLTSGQAQQAATSQQPAQLQRSASHGYVGDQVLLREAAALGRGLQQQISRHQLTSLPPGQPSQQQPPVASQAGQPRQPVAMATPSGQPVVVPQAQAAVVPQEPPAEQPSAQTFGPQGLPGVQASATPQALPAATPSAVPQGSDQQASDLPMLPLLEAQGGAEMYPQPAMASLLQQVTAAEQAEDGERVLPAPTMAAVPQAPTIESGSAVNQMIDPVFLQPADLLSAQITSPFAAEELRLKIKLNSINNKYKVTSANTIAEYEQEASRLRQLYRTKLHDLNNARLGQTQLVLNMRHILMSNQHLAEAMKSKSSWDQAGAESLPRI
eukprot:SM000066S20465  [mRNA]  locus=s66:625915:636553:+ [translate_table: standard]